MYYIKLMTWIDIDIHDTSVARWQTARTLSPGLSCLTVRFVLFVLCPAHQNHRHSGTGVSVSNPKQHKSVGKSTCLKTKPMLCYQCYHELSQTMMNSRISRQYCCLLWECTSKAELSRNSKCDCIAVKAYRCIQVYKWRLINSWKYCSDRFILLPSSSKPFANPLKFRKRPWKTPARCRRDAVPRSSSVFSAKVPPVPVMDATDIDSPRPDLTTWLDMARHHWSCEMHPPIWVSTQFVRAPHNIK